MAAAPRSGLFSRRVAAAMGARSSSVAASSSSRLRRRSAASSGLRHTTSRSPGNSSLVTSARSRSSNSDGEHGGDVAVGQAADAGEGVVGIDELLTAEDAAEHIDGGVGQLGEIGEGALLDAAAVAVGLSEEDGGRRGAVGHALDIHGHLLSHITPATKN